MLDFNANLALISLFLLVIITTAVSSQNEDSEYSTLYHNNSQLEEVLRSLVKEYPEKSRIYSIGTSRKDVDIWVLELNGNLAELNSANPKLGIPHVKLVGNVHGNEPVGREMILKLAQHLLENYTTDGEVKWLMDNTRISLLPCLNPDGFELAVEKEEDFDCEHNTLYSGRGNAVGVDLNKNYPDYFRKNQFRNEPESEALKQWMFDNNFVLSASLHDGALLVTYPFNSLESSHLWSHILNSTANGMAPRNYTNLRNRNHQQRNSGKPRSSTDVTNFFNEWHVRERRHRRSPTPDDDVFQALARVYTKANPKMREGCKNSMKISEGIINGAEDQPSVGTMADYNYHAHGCMELTMQISCCTYPPSAQLEGLWNDNKQALMMFLAQGHRGVRGVVRNEEGKPIEFAKVVVRGRQFHTNTTKNGEFWKILTRSGLYTLKITAEGYQTLDRYPFIVPEVENPSRPNYIWLDIKMKRETNSDQQKLTGKLQSSTSRPSEDDNGVELLNWPAKNRQPENLAVNSQSESIESSQDEEMNSSASTSEESPWDIFKNNYATIMIVFGLIALILVVALICTEQFSARSFK
ncbi:hypothetical protein LSTR_LSTR011139 [Laodelphax striatellus]|uniref:Peptidase M14 domain-containing protein n=1 Tax=Laodelphax striatellus TaxID=195883 RepID=A0A482X2X4_LAOST|nr:hypothetical protein LSTR_LSTR011139 [Laodelphax striatellus]